MTGHLLRNALSDRARPPGPPEHLNHSQPAARLLAVRPKRPSGRRRQAAAAKDLQAAVRVRPGGRASLGGLGKGCCGGGAGQGARRAGGGSCKAASLPEASTSCGLELMTAPAYVTGRWQQRCRRMGSGLNRRASRAPPPPFAGSCSRAAPSSGRRGKGRRQRPDDPGRGGSDPSLVIELMAAGCGVFHQRHLLLVKPLPV